MRVTKAEDSAWLRLLLFGPGGSGKTFFGGTFDDDERTAPTLFLASDPGLTTLVGRDTDIVVIRDWKDYNEAYAELARPDTKYRSAFVDGLTETQTGGLLALLDRPRKSGQEDIISQPEWGVILVQMRRFVRHWRDLQMHVGMTCLSDEDLDRLEGKVQVPFVQGSFRKEVPGLFDVVAYLAQTSDDNGDPQRLLLLHDWPGYRVKARAPMNVTVPTDIEDPNVTKLLDALGYASKPTRAKRSK